MIKVKPEIHADARIEPLNILYLYSNLRSLSLSRSLSLGVSDRDVDLVDAERNTTNKKAKGSYSRTKIQRRISLHFTSTETQIRDTKPKKGAVEDQYSLLLMAALMDERGPWL